MNTYFAFCRSPIGELLLTANGSALTGLYVKGGDHYPATKQDWTESSELAIFKSARSQLEEYFSGERTSFNLNIEADGTTFQKEVWNQLGKIPYANTISYGQLALRIGNPKAARAVGRANGSNPLSILVPCHRVIGTDGSLTGYGGGVHCKEYLLKLELRQHQTARQMNSSDAAL